MFQLEFSDGNAGLGAAEGVQPSAVDRDEIEAIWFMRWEEHCVECAMPHCYSTCSLYARRADLQCARFVNGIVPNPAFPGQLPHGAQVGFKRWGKLEANLQWSFETTLSEFVRISELDRRSGRAVSQVAPLWNKALPSPRLNLFALHGKWRRHQLDGRRRRSQGTRTPDELVIEVFAPKGQSCSLIVELIVDASARYRTSLALEPGNKLARIPFEALGTRLEELLRPGTLLRVYPAGDAQVTLVFRWLALVAYKPDVRSRQLAPAKPQLVVAAPAPAAKVKCVVWDLDNTLWRGVLGELGHAGVVLDQRCIDVIKELDRRGILQSVASKNDHADAWGKLQECGLDQYFLYPQIHWQEKSGSLRAIAENLNINVDTFAFIDDSAFERQEVADALPQVRVFDVAEIEALLDQPCLDVPISKEGARRREMYRTEEQRRQSEQSFGGRYLEFLRSCEMRARVFEPQGADEVGRCLELIQRTNQLNTSGIRYSQEQFLERLAAPDCWCLAVSCADKFGDYGIVGFLSIRSTETSATVTDFVLSCRVAQKKVENAIFEFVRTACKRRAVTQLALDFVPSERNGIMRKSLDEVGFTGSGAQAREQLMLTCATPVADGDVVRLEYLDRSRPADVASG
jgi:FkbH-like protein